MNTRQSGFTMIDIMITVALLVVQMMVAAPSVRDLMLNARMNSTANDLMTDLAIARSETIKQGARTAVCTSNSGTACTDTPWQQGGIVFLDPDADSNLAAAADITITLCDTRTIATVGASGAQLRARLRRSRPGPWGAETRRAPRCR